LYEITGRLLKGTTKKDAKLKDYEVRAMPYVYFAEAEVATRSASGFLSNNKTMKLFSYYYTLTHFCP
jgi:hypothetical protein